MNTPSGGPWRFRWGKTVFLKSLGRDLPGASMIPGRLFRRAPVLGPVLAWIASMVVYDLRQPQSRIKAFARRLLEKRISPLHVKAVVVGQQAIEGPDRPEQTEKTGEHKDIPEE